MKNYTKQEILKIILSVAKEYDEKLNDKHFKITYQKGKDKEENKRMQKDEKARSLMRYVPTTVFNVLRYWKFFFYLGKNVLW